MNKPSIPFSGNGQLLTKLLTKAAGLDEHRVRKLVCTIETGKVVMFDVEFLGTEEHIGEAMKTVDVTALMQGVAEWKVVPTERP